MIQKHRISTNIGHDQKINVEIKQEYDILQILSLKFSQNDVYASGVCSDYGVVVGRITANNGFGVPNARVSIFVPLSDLDELDPVISSLYPYKYISDKDDTNHRYNLLPKRQQHGGHAPTGTFFDQEEIVTREEYLEVFEKYYTYTVKTNSSGDFMIWGVPIGKQIIHVDVDLSDIGCFSLRPYDFIKQGVGQDKFERFYKFKSSEDLDGLPQIVKFEKTIEVYPFWGNEDLCQIGITRTDYDLSDVGIKIEPVSLILTSTITDADSHAVKKNGVIEHKSGYKCNLQTTAGIVECIRYTGHKVYGSDGETLYPELEKLNITEVIDEDGVAMVVLPMNLEYTYTNEFGEQETTNDKNKGIPTTTIARFRFSLTYESGKLSTAKYLVPNIREFNNTVSGVNNYGEYDPYLLTTYQFSDVFEDYLMSPTGYTILEGAKMLSTDIKHKQELMLNVVNDEEVPQDYFYKFIYGKVYTVSSFQGTHYESPWTDAVIPIVSLLSRKDRFLGIKEIRPNSEEDCSSSTNYFPVNFAYKNSTKISTILGDVMLYIDFIFTIISMWIYETLGSWMLTIGSGFDNVLNITELRKIGVLLYKTAFKIQEAGQKKLTLTTYPDCEECSSDINYSNQINLRDYCKSGEVKTQIDLNTSGNICLLYKDLSWLNTNESVKTTYLTDYSPNDSARESCATMVTNAMLSTLETHNNKYNGEIYSLNKGGFNSFYGVFSGNTNSNVTTPMKLKFDKNLVYYNEPQTGFHADLSFSNSTLTLKYLNSSGTSISAPVTMTVTVTMSGFLGNQDLIITLTSGSSIATLSTGTRRFINVKSFSWVSNTQNIHYLTYNGVKFVTYLGLSFTYEQWKLLTSDDFSQSLRNKFAIVKLYDLEHVSPNRDTSINIETGCAKYDKFYDEINNQYDFIWGNNEGYNGNETDLYFNLKAYSNGGLEESGHSATNLVESYEMPALPNNNLLSTVGGNAASYYRMPRFVTLSFNNSTWETIELNPKTKSGLSEIRDGVINLVPVIKTYDNSPSNNYTIIQEWYKRKRVGLHFCAGVVNYSFIDNWLNGLLYFFKFEKNIAWDDIQILDLFQRGSEFPRELVFYNVLDQNFYYRSTPYDPKNKKFIGQTGKNMVELLHPTTFYDVGVRDEFFREICFDPRVDPECSVIRDIGSTSYQDPAKIMEYAINYRLDITNGKFDVDDFFTNRDYGKIIALDGDITQLLSINSEAGIQGFDLDTSQYFLYNGELMDPEDPYFNSYFKMDGSYAPVSIDFKLHNNGEMVRKCLNNRLGDYTQTVPFYLWDKRGTGFGPYGSMSDTQGWDRNHVASMPLQRLFSIGSVTDTTTNYLMPGNEEEYLLKPMSISHPTYAFTGNTGNMLSRFDVIQTYSPIMGVNDNLLSDPKLGTPWGVNTGLGTHSTASLPNGDWTQLVALSNNCYFWIQSISPLLLNTDYTLSFDLLGTTPIEINFGFEFSETFNANSNTVPLRVSKTFKWTENPTYRTCYFVVPVNGNSNLIRNLKLEHGTVETVPSATGFIENNLWLHVTSGTTKNPLMGTIYVVVDKMWKKPDGNASTYVVDYRENFIFETAKNYSGTKQVLSTPFMFYFGLRPHKTALDELTKYYGPKGAFPSTD